LEGSGTAENHRRFCWLGKKEKRWGPSALRKEEKVSRFFDPNDLRQPVTPPRRERENGAFVGRVSISENDITPEAEGHK